METYPIFLKQIYIAKGFGNIFFLIGNENGFVSTSIYSQTYNYNRRKYNVNEYTLLKKS